MKNGRLAGGILLVAGTAIGGGMLALPVLTAQGGFFPALLLYFLSWLFMTLTGLFLVEVFLWHKSEVNLISMASTTIGKWGKVATWMLYLFLFYALSTAYVSGGGQLVLELASALTLDKIPALWGPLLFVLIFAPFVIASPRATSRINTICMVGLFLSFLLFLALGTPHVSVTRLAHADWSLAFLAMPVAFTAFGFQGIVPTLTEYLGRSGKRATLAICIGTTLPLLVYIIWEGLILGVIPLEGLFEACTLGQSAVYPLKQVLAAPLLSRIGASFAFFAIVTSFFGVTLGLLDFLSDALKIKKNLSGRFRLSLLVFLPPLAFAVTSPCLFLTALHYAGGIGGALLLGLMPLLMTWYGRYQRSLRGPFALPGGKPLLIVLMLFVLFELVVMAVSQFAGK